MRKPLELAGKTFGDLTVIEPAGKTQKGAILWRCHCNRCGNDCVVEGQRLTATRPKKDCGCSWADRTADLSGETFGSLFVIRRTGTDKHGNKLYLCSCSHCGEEKIFPASTIRTNPISCGCQRHDSERMKKISGKAIPVNVVGGTQVYTVTREDPNRGNSTGYRGVRYYKNRNVYAVQFIVKGARYFKYGFCSAEEAHIYYEAWHDQILREQKIKDPRKERNKEQA